MRRENPVFLTAHEAADASREDGKGPAIAAGLVAGVYLWVNGEVNYLCSADEIEDLTQALYEGLRLAGTQEAFADLSSEPFAI